MGAAYCWGWNVVGQLGDGTTDNRTTPVVVSMPAGVTFASLMSGMAYNCALTSAGAAYCWGDNHRGELGDGTNTQRRTPVAVSMPAGVTFASLSTGSQHTCALTVAGVAYCWGANSEGQLGNDTLTDSNTPVKINSPAGVTWASLRVSVHHTCALTRVGVAYCWGRNSLGQLGDGTRLQRDGMVQVKVPNGFTFASLSAGANHTCALTRAGVAYCWGYNGNGLLGNGTFALGTQPLEVKRPTGVTFASISAGANHNCALTNAGAAYCWGWNREGQIGDNTTTDRSTSVAVRMPAGVTFASLSVGGDHTCARTRAGAAYCWGDNGNGQLGDGTDTSRITPVIVP